MDEPTSSLTLTETRRLLEIVKDLNADDVSIIYIPHRLHEVEEIADRAVVLRDGRTAGNLARSEITRDHMVRMMVGRDLQDFFKSGHGNESKENGHDWFAVRNLRTLRYPNTPVSFNVGRGEVLGLAGLVGAGRSEVARAIFGIDTTTAVNIALANKTLRLTSPQDAISQGIYLVPEDRRLCGLIVDFNIRENISLPGLDRYSTAGLISAERETAAARKACKTINIKTSSPEMKAANLSGGNQQKVVLAKWLALSPKGLIFYETTRGIDVAAQ